MCAMSNESHKVVCRSTVAMTFQIYGLWQSELNAFWEVLSAASVELKGKSPTKKQKNKREKRTSSSPRSSCSCSSNLPFWCCHRPRDHYIYLKIMYLLKLHSVTHSDKCLCTSIACLWKRCGSNNRVSSPLLAVPVPVPVPELLLFAKVIHTPRWQ